MAYDKNFPANDGFLAEFPEKQRAQIEAIINDAIVNAKTVQNLDIGNDNGNIPVANGTECKNLNAGLLNGKMASDMAPKVHGHDTATPNSDGFMSNIDKAKLNTIAENAQVNPNVFTNIKIGNLVLQPDAKDDTLELVAGTNIKLTLDTTNDKITVEVIGTVPNAAKAAACTGNAATASDVTSAFENNAVAFPISNFRTTIFGSSAQGTHAKPFRVIDVSGTPHNSGFAWGVGDTHGFIHTQYGDGKVFVGGGHGDVINWYKQLATTDGTVANANMVAGLAVSGGRNNAGNKIVRTDGNGYLQTGYINSSDGDEGNNSNPARVWGTNGGDSYLRTYLISALSVNYANTAGDANAVNGHVFNWSGQGGQPTWLWGGNDAGNMYVYNPVNFDVKSVGGYTAAQLIAASGGVIASSLGANGYLKFYNGFIEQYMKSSFSTVSGWADITFTFPIAFKTAIKYVIPGFQSSENSLTNNIRIKSISLTAATFSIYCNHDGSSNAIVYCYVGGN